jgi:hypothetical protein
MKTFIKLFAISAIVVTVWFSSCTKEKRYCCIPPPPNGVFAVKDGKDWRALIVTDTSVNDSANIYAKTDTNMLNFRFAATHTTSAYEVPKNYSATYYVLKGTYGKLTYILDKAAANNIQLSYGSGEKAGHVPNVWIFSKFNLTFKLATPTGNADFDNKRINFSNGIIGHGLQN